MTLRGKRVAITRPHDQAAEMAEVLRQYGAEPVLYPTVAIEPVQGDTLQSAQSAAAGLGQQKYEALILTSANAARLLKPLVADVNWPSVTVFAIGHSSAKVAEAWGASPIVAKDSHSEGMASCIEGHFPTLAGKRFFMPHAREGRTHLVDALAAKGAQVERVILYETIPLVEGPALQDADWVTFTSPSAVRAFAQRSKLPKGARIACIGRTTAKAAEEAGLNVELVPDAQSIAALVGAMDSAS